MPKLRKLNSTRLSTTVKTSDICGFWNLFAQSKDIISNNYKSRKVHFDWIQSFLQEAQTRIENVQKDSTSDTSQLDGEGSAIRKNSGQTVLSSQESGGTRRRRRNVQKDSCSDNSQLDEVFDTSNQAVSSCQENGGPKRRRRKKRSSKLQKSSVTFEKTAPVKSTCVNGDVNLNEDKEDVNENISFKTESDASQDIIEGSPLCKSGRAAQVKVGTPVGVKEKDPSVVLEPLVTFVQCSEPTVTQNDCHHTTSVAPLTNRLQEEHGANGGGEAKDTTVVLQRLTGRKSTEINQCTVSLNNDDHTTVKELSQENEVKTTRTSSTIKCRDSVIIPEPLVITQCTELGKFPVRTSNRISGKRKLTEVCDSFPLRSESVSRASETPRRSSRTSVTNRRSEENLEPVRKMPKLSHMKKSFSSEESDDNKRNTMLSEEIDVNKRDTVSSEEIGVNTRNTVSSEEIDVNKRNTVSSEEIDVNKRNTVTSEEIDVNKRNTVSSEEIDVNKRNTVSKPHGSDSDSADSGTCCIGSSGESGSGSQRSNTSISNSSSKDSLNAPKNWQLQSFKQNGQLNRQRSQESIGFHTPENATLKKDFNNSSLRLQSYKPMLSQSRTTPKSTFVFSSSKTANHLPRSKLISGSCSTKPCTPLHGLNTSILKSQAAVLEAEKEKYKQEEAKRQQEKEQALLKKQQLLQMRVEEQKRKREARMQKNLEARQQLDREKAQRHKIIEQKEKKVSNIAKEKAKEVKKNRPRTDAADDCGLAKKPTDRVLHTPVDAAKLHHKEALCAKPVVCVVKHTNTETTKSSENKSVKPSEPQTAALNSTFVKSDEAPCESYEMTPRPRSTYCNYDISDLQADAESDDESAPSKPIPSWAVGPRFKQALINQHYNPPNLDELFGATVVPNLREMFTVKKPRYLKRTSSAVWNTPDKLVFAVKSYS